VTALHIIGLLCALWLLCGLATLIIVGLGQRGGDVMLWGDDRPEDEGDERRAA
jgi:hypothetical protein